jgi:hypothetical protein
MTRFDPGLWLIHLHRCARFRRSPGFFCDPFPLQGTAGARGVEARSEGMDEAAETWSGLMSVRAPKIGYADAINLTQIRSGPSNSKPRESAAASSRPRS